MVNVSTPVRQSDCNNRRLISQGNRTWHRVKKRRHVTDHVWSDAVAQAIQVFWRHCPGVQLLQHANARPITLARYGALTTYESENENVRNTKQDITRSANHDILAPVAALTFAIAKSKLTEGRWHCTQLPITLKHTSICQDHAILAARSVAYAVIRCLSVCVSVTFVNSVKMNKHVFKIFFTIG